MVVDFQSPRSRSAEAKEKSKAKEKHEPSEEHSDNQQSTRDKKGPDAEDGRKSASGNKRECDSAGISQLAQQTESDKFWPVSFHFLKTFIVLWMTWFLIRNK